MTELRELVNDANALISVIRSRMSGGTQTHDHPIFNELAALHPTDVNLFDLIEQTVADKASRQSAYLFLVPALSKIETVTAEQIIHLLTTLRVHDSTYHWAIERELRQSFARLPIGRETLKLAVMKPIEQEEIQLLAGALAQTEGPASLVFLETLPAETDSNARNGLLAGVCAVIDTHAVEIDPALANRLWPLAREAIAVDRSSFLGWEVACRIMSLHEEARREVASGAVRGPAKAQAAIYRWLTIRPDSKWPKEPALTLVKNLYDAGANDPAVRASVDGILAALLIAGGPNAEMLTLCEDIFSTGDDTVKSRFPDLLGIVATNPSFYSAVLTRILLSPSTAVLSIRQIIQHGFQQPEWFVPDPGQMLTAAREGRRRAIRRVLAEAVSGPALCSFAYAFASNEELQPWGAEVFRDLFMNYIAHEFPQAAIEFLQKKAAAPGQDERVTPLLLEVLAPIQEWQAVLIALPIRAELNPSQDKILALRRRAIREQRQIHRKAREASIFAQSVTSLNVAQGRSVVSRDPRRPPAIIEMKTFTHTFEMPGSEVADPLGALTRRMQYLKEEK